SFGGHKIPATDEEADRFDCAVSRYVDDNGSYIGFVSALLAGEVC
ncbi:nuclease, partial [Escherichia coli]|nr:nuclease [Escherichia coli]